MLLSSAACTALCRLLESSLHCINIIITLHYDRKYDISNTLGLGIVLGVIYRMPPDIILFNIIWY